MTTTTAAGTLLRFGVRRDRVRLLVWVLSLGLLAVYTVIALDRVYPTAVDRAARAAVVDTPAGILFSGPGFGTDAYTLGAMVANELGLTIMIALAIMSILLVVRHTRAEEENGQAELLLAGAVGRRAALTTALVLVLLANVAVGTLIAVGLIGTGLAAVDSVAFAAGLALTGIVFGGVAAVTAQLFEHGRTASSAAMAVLAVAAITRGIGDILDHGSSWLSWLSPVAWAQQTRPYVDLRWWPLLLSLLLIAALTTRAYALNGRRDFAAGAVAPRRGSAVAAPWLSGVGPLLVRLQRGTVIGWAIALLLLGVTFGSLTEQAADMIADNRVIAEAFSGSGGSFTDAFLAVSALYLVFCTAAFAIGSVLRLRAEETSGRAEFLLTHPVDRRRLLGSGLAVTGLSALLLLVLGGLGMGVAAAVSVGDAELVWAGLAACLVHAPAVLVLAGLTAVLVGVAPRLSMFAWVALAWSLLAGMFGPLLNLPEWALKFGPFGWDPQVPAEDFDVAALVGLSVVAAGLALLALGGFRRRDVPA
jgi:ABC-2 type transport system permease protein